ncbi:MAG: oligopeptide/dipeptide ABC transporter ATP-binding protein [Anaerolineae bacterium]
MAEQEAGGANLVRLERLEVQFPVRRGLFKVEMVPAVAGVSLTVRRGETVAVVGESGSGKTTLGRASIGLLRPAAGRVFFHERDIAHFSAAQMRAYRRRVQAIFQDPYASIDPFMSVFQAVEEPLVIHRIGSPSERRRRVLMALEAVRLTPAEEVSARYPHLLSGGQRQRLGIARALVLQPEYVVADEPVSMIDASSRAEILNVLRELRQRFDIAFLYITHDIATARHFAQRLVVMYLGRVLEEGEATRVIEYPLHPYTRALIAAVPEPDPANRLRERPTLPGEPPNPAQAPSGCPFYPRCPQYMLGTCEVARPELLLVEPGHFVACYLYNGGRSNGC